MSAFEKLDRMAGGTLDRVNAVRFILKPKQPATPNGRPQADPDRDEIEGKGIFERNTANHGIELGVRKSYREANDLRALQVGRNPILSVDTKYFQTIEVWPRRGDIVELPDKTNIPKLEVTTVEPDGLSRLLINFAEQGTDR